MPKYIVSFLVLAIVPICFAQSEWYHYDWTKNKAADKLELYTQTLNADLSKYKNSEYLGIYDLKFISTCAIGLYQNMECGNLYQSIDGYENYVRRVLEATVGDKQLCEQIQILFSRNVNFNASMSENGVLTINVGLMPQLRNEAELALILAHEVGHFLNQDVVRNYGRYMAAAHHSGGSGVFGLINGIKGANEYYEFSRNIESNADVNALRFMDVSGYSFISSLNAYKTMEALQTRYQLKEGKIRNKWRTHPHAGERFDYLSELSTKRQLSGSKKYLVDSVTFAEFKRICFQQCVNICLMDGELDDLITLSFSHYLLAPEDGNNLAVLIEAIRRKLNYSSEEQIGNKQFILDQYLSPISYKYEEFLYLRNKNVSILQCLNKGLIDLRSDEIRLIKAYDLVDTTVIEFKTYFEAYVYFKEKASIAGNQLATHYQFFGKAPDYSQSENYVANNRVFETNALIKQQGKVVLKDTSLIVFLPIWNSFSPLLTHDYQLQEFLQLNSEFKHLADGNPAVKTAHLLATELEMDPQRIVYNLCSQVYETVLKTKPLLGVYTSTINWLTYYPEAYNLFEKRGIHTLYLCSVSKKNEKKLEVDFFKITLPGYGKNTFLLKQIYTPLRLKDGLYPDLETVAKEFKYFLKYNSK